MKKNLHILRYSGRQTFIINDNGRWYLGIGKNDRRKSLQRKAIRWAAKVMANPDMLITFLQIQKAA